ncbi:ABC transporter permease [Brucella pituitosa]|uniref:ABC transporter permease n=1 Tax=Brucella pituitosa TaxID=571256 RepID=A0A643EU71_9HYPH|nr:MULTISPECIES: ABC transporter permease [Brucella]PQZ48131.1 ABC transporter permease [Ochrobactrum sp. MYb19]PRA54395.1 ABC transporter permease [Ochrobactrum sp. MYb68]PRA64316.1 ABC transporter permease [Ochrobactrum sp. MYb18]PRA75174.1 ABC transporter permease [Brucella thiophenivorans]PRA84187.1 ABC transporter permease [Ochrobactrum sp. MYb29]PRA89615.1 ABC transporter permease [Ochrobactrum sp. MYb14]PRA96644.1 ABC transporter permease [Ochrobactrum sp. MYb15]TCQ76179.1 ribose tra
MQTNPLSNLIRTPLAGVFIALLVIFALSAILSPYFLTPYNLSVVARGLAFVGLITIAQSMLMVLGELDLSLGVIGGLSGVVSGILMMRMGFEPYSAMFLAILLGLCLGLFNGFLVTFLRLHSLVLTIGTAGIFGGANLVLTRGVAITGIPREVHFLGRGDLFGIPVPFIIMFFVLLIATFVMLKTPFGRYMYAIGNNRDGARMLGIRVDRVRLMVFGAAGAIAGLAGVLMVARLGTAQPSIGDSWVLAPIAASVIGGVATTGGIGSPIGAILGAGIIAIIENIIVLFGVSPYWQGIVSGAIVVLAISFDAISRRYLRRDAH